MTDEISRGPTDGDAPDRFWSRFEGAYGALLAALRGSAGIWPAPSARGAIKIAKRDAVVLAEGIAALFESLSPEPTGHDQGVTDAGGASRNPPAPSDPPPRQSDPPAHP